MSAYACPHCGEPSPTFAAAKAHVVACPRLRALGFDLECKVRDRKMTLAEAEAIHAARPKVPL